MELSSIVDIDRYPIDAKGAAYAKLVEDTRRALAHDGCAVLEGFLAPAVPALKEESNALAPAAYVKKRYGNAYSRPTDERLPPDHPVNIVMERTNAFVAGDLIPEASPLKALYRSETFKRFIADCLGEAHIYEYADPLAGLVINVLERGWQHPWHYDTNEFIVSTMTQASEAGGTFEYCPNIRSPKSEAFEQVRRVLRDEDRTVVKQLALVPGDIQIFLGRFSLHRVTPVGGPSARHTAIFAYAKRPGVIGKPERTKYLFGRLADVHLRNELTESRADALLD